jgi:hypothetical protein
MRPDASNSRTAAQRSHSLSRRWTSRNGIRRRFRRGGKGAPQASAHFALLALSHFQPHQKTIAQHYGDGVAMKAIPAPPLILIPAQFRFGFLMILLDPVATVRILDHHGQRRRGREVTPGKPELAETDFREAIMLAQKMGAKTYKLRATMVLARLLRDTGRRDEARNMLTEI